MRLVFVISSREIGVSESLKQQIDRLREIYKSELDPRGRAFVPLADAHRQLGDLDEALTVIQEGLVEHPDFASAHVVLGWVYRSREDLDDAMRSFERVLALDAENTIARAAIAELIEDQRALAEREVVAAQEAAERSDDAPAEDERPVVPIASLAPAAVVETVAAPEADRPVVPIASLAPGAVVEAVAAPEADRPVVPIASLAPEAPAPTIAPSDAVPEGSDGDKRPAVSIASLAPGVPVAPDGSTVAPSDAALEVSGDDRPVVPIASRAPGEPDAQVASRAASQVAPQAAPPTVAPDAAPESIPDDDERLVVPITSLAPGEQGTVPIATLAPQAGEDAPENDGSGGGEIYTQTLAELYAVQGATDRAIEVYVKLIADDPDNGALQKRLDALEALEPGSEGVRAELNVQAGLGALMAKDERRTVPIESLAPDGNAG